MSTSDTHKSLVVLGAGPGGYAAAFRAADLGFPVTLVDPRPNPGGVCLYEGCIPSKALLHVAHLLEESRRSPSWGVFHHEPRIDLGKLRDYKNQVVEKMTQGIGSLAARRKVRYLQGTGKFTSKNTLEVQTEDKVEELTFDFAIIATGSRPSRPQALAVESPRLWDSTQALELKEIPESLLCVGGGVIGLELATFYAALGTHVSVVEMEGRFLSAVDPDLMAVFNRSFKSKLKNAWTNTKVKSLKAGSHNMEAALEDSRGKSFQANFSHVLLAIGRIPNTESLQLEKVGITLDKGFIQVNGRCQTTAPHVYAIGDVTGQPFLAHRATHQGHAVVESLSGPSGEDPLLVPSVVYTDPEIAWVGLTEQEAKARDVPYRAAKFPWAASGRAAAMGRTDGVTKLLVDPESKVILGAGLVGVSAGELLAECTLAIRHKLTAHDLAKTVHPHPTLSETLMEAAEAALGQSDHYYVPKRSGK